jgi:small subunit ribosomal protein S8
MTDPIADMLTRIRNALLARRSEVRMPFSNMKFSIAKILEKEAYVGAVQQVGEGTKRELLVSLKYVNQRPAIRRIARISRPGRRVYRGARELPFVLSDRGLAVISTPNGLMTNKEARKRRLGGEVLCEVY